MPRIILLTDLSEEYAKNLLKGIVRYSKEHEPWVLCKMPFSYRIKHGVEGVLKWAKKWKADGVIAQFYDTDRVEIFRENGIAAIAQDFKSRFTQIPNITGAHHLTGKMGANYFIQKGFKNFAFFGFKDIVWSSERCAGFLDEIKKYQFENNFYEYQNADFAEPWHYESAPLIAWLQQLPKPIAIMACDDNQGHHIAEVCKQCGIKIPEEIALLGVDNDNAVCTLSDPPLSSINQAVKKGGYETAQLMSRMIQNPNGKYEDVVVYPTHIITRKSTDIYATNDKYISATLKYIHQNVDKKMTIGTIIKQIPLSRRLLENRFKQEIGVPIYTYIMNLRIEKFAHQLLESNLSIMEIAEEIGYSDYKNIARRFKKIKGCTPSEYKIKNSIR
ncbi:XylR family transcriptional regulator [Bacteroidia bacterium]|nr:XylR family transcriptional regulator [Bacteroidia bacterium]GHT81695.1 XylR family transcriptional regulator [Bacteroidia bacterium]